MSAYRLVCLSFFHAVCLKLLLSCLHLACDLFDFLSRRLFVCLPSCTPVYWSVWLPVSLSPAPIFLFLSLPTCLDCCCPAYFYVSLPSCPSVFLSHRLFVCLSYCPSSNWSVCHSHLSVTVPPSCLICCFPAFLYVCLPSCLSVCLSSCPFVF
jgi:hypothetical protein